MSRFYYIGAFSFPEGDAGAARVLNIGKALRHTGFDVIFGGWQKEGLPGDRRSDGSSYYQGFQYHSLNEFRQSEMRPIRRLHQYLSRGEKTVQWLATVGLTRNDVVIAYGGSSIFLLRLKALCGKKGVSLITDCVEWYDPKHLVGGQFGLVRWDQELRMRLVNKRVRKIIAISTYLEAYYKNEGCRVIRIPPLIDVNDHKWHLMDQRSPDNGRLHLGYAGTPAKKDLLGNVLKGMAQLRKVGKPVTLHLIGPSYQDAAICLEGDTKILQELNSDIIFHGRIPQSKVPAILQQCDFTVLLRPNERYANAGFPTKLVESLAAGVPIIVNLTGDIDQYIHDGEEGILLYDQSTKSLVQGIERILGISRDRWLEMRLIAKQRAIKSFDYRNYIGACRDFFSN